MNTEEKLREVIQNRNRSKAEAKNLQSISKPANAQTILFKPKYSGYIVLLSGILCCLFNAVSTYILGFILILSGVLIQFVIKDYETAYISPENVILLDHEMNQAYVVQLSDIKQWSTNNSITLIKNDGTKIGVETFRSNDAQKWLREYLPKKEDTYLLKEKRKNEKIINPLNYFIKSKKQ